MFSVSFHQLLWPPVCWAVLAFTVYAVASYLTADVEYVARLEFSRVLVYALIFFVVLHNLRRPETARLIAFTLVLLAMAISFYALCQFLTHSDRVWNFISPYRGRAGGTFICPKHFAGFLEMLLPLALAGVLVARQKPALKILLGYAALVMVAGLAVTLSRGGWLAAGGALAVFFAVLFWQRRFRLPLLLGAVTLAAVAGVCYWNSPAIQLRAQRMFSAQPEAKAIENIRFELWKPARQIWRENFWFGAGPGHFDVRYREFRPQNVQMRAEHVHNDYLETLADWGVAGAALAAAAGALLGYGVVKTWRARRDGASNDSAFLLGAATGLFALLLHSAVDFNLHVPANALLAASLMALLANQAAPAAAAPRPAGKVALTLGLLAAVVFLGAHGWRRGREYVLLQRAAQAKDFSPEQSAAWTAAWAVEPKNFETTYALGEVLRVKSMDGNRNYAVQARLAIAWYERGMKLNSHDGNNWLRRGMCRDWLEQHDAAAADFARAEALDPNGYYTIAHVGWHHVQAGNYAAARDYFERSQRLDYVNNPVAEKYLPIVHRKLLEAAAKP
ncbi:MAG: O-antigen ligase family protein [Verrucomicrobia bacterium]|nr:O-antigen ligase family protein [Verrucomicrobiota bacterium]